MSVEIKRIKLVNFQGIYTALGLKELEIDRTESSRNIILILGENGSGKTTILNELTPVPLEHIGFRNKSRIIPDEIGIKELDFLVNDSILYKCKIVYDTKKKTTNCFIVKCDGITEEELNPNGNVSSYMEMLDHELGFTKKYITVGYLTKSLTDFISMKATDRNEYISDWLPDIAEFLDAYKLSVKLLNKTKRDIENYNKDIGKISSINYELELNQLENNISHFNNQLDIIKSQITKLSTYEKQINEHYITRTQFSDRMYEFRKKTGELSNTYKSLFNESNSFSNLNIDISDPISVQNSIKQVEIRLKTNELNISNCEKRIFEIKTEIDSFNNTLSKSGGNNKTYRNEDISMIIRNIEEMNSSLELYIKSFEPLKDRFEEELRITESDIMVLKSLISQFEDKFVSINNLINTDSIISIDTIEKIISTELENVSNQQKIFDTINKELTGINNEIYKYENNTLSKQILDKRPEFCIKKSCDIVEEIKKYVYPEYACKELRKEAEIKEKELKELNSSIASTNEYIENHRRSIGYLQELNNILFHNSDLIGKFPREIIEYLEKEPLSIYNSINTIKLILDDLIQFNSIQNKIRETEAIISNLINTKSVMTIKNEISEKLSKHLIEYDSLLTQKQTLFKEREGIESEIDKLNNIEEYTKEFSKKVSLYNSDIERLKQEQTDLNIYNKHIYYKSIIEDELSKLHNKKLTIESELIDYNKKRDEMNTSYISKKQLEKMRNELQEEFNRVSVLNKVWSPKSNGVSYPSLIISNFLNELTIKTNNDLRRIWGSNLKIEEFRLGATEFNIIVNRDGTIIDDASQCSDGERSTLGLAISFAIIDLNIQEHGYNVVRCDEIDQSYDSERRASFVEMIKDRLDDLKCKSCFIISHNNEFDSVEADVILLKGYSLTDTKMNNKNVIFQI